MRIARRPIYSSVSTATASDWRRSAAWPGGHRGGSGLRRVHVGFTSVTRQPGGPAGTNGPSPAAALGHPRVEAENPYWTENGAVTVEDPDHWRVVLMPRPFASEDEPPVTVEWYAGDRDALRPLFELAEDSAAELDSYLHSGRVLVARSGPRIVGHLQLTGTGQPGQAEVKNMAVREDQQGQGLGRRLMQAALTLLAAEGVTTVRVATAAADLGNLRFYQRQGFRMHSIERDAFTESSGYPPGSQVAGIPLRDRVWLDIQLGLAPMSVLTKHYEGVALLEVWGTRAC